MVNESSYVARSYCVVSFPTEVIPNYPTHVGARGIKVNETVNHVPQKLIFWSFPPINVEHKLFSYLCYVHSEQLSLNKAYVLSLVHRCESGVSSTALCCTKLMYRSFTFKILFGLSSHLYTIPVEYKEYDTKDYITWTATRKYYRHAVLGLRQELCRRMDPGLQVDLELCMDNA